MQVLTFGSNMIKIKPAVKGSTSNTNTVHYGIAYKNTNKKQIDTGAYCNILLTLKAFGQTEVTCRRCTDLLRRKRDVFKIVYKYKNVFCFGYIEIHICDDRALMYDPKWITIFHVRNLTPEDITKLKGNSGYMPIKKFFRPVIKNRIDYNNYEIWINTNGVIYLPSYSTLISNRLAKI